MLRFRNLLRGLIGLQPVDPEPWTTPWVTELLPKTDWEEGARTGGGLYAPRDPESRSGSPEDVSRLYQ